MEDAIGLGADGRRSETVLVAQIQVSPCSTVDFLDGNIRGVAVDVEAHATRVVPDNGVGVGGDVIEDVGDCFFVSVVGVACERVLQWKQKILFMYILRTHMYMMGYGEMLGIVVPFIGHARFPED